MDRPTTGRRHVRAGSVHVTELINRQAPAVPRPADSPGGTGDGAGDSGGIVESPLASHRRPPSRGAQLAKLTSLGVAVLVLCAAVTTATMISQSRARDSAGDRPALWITGDQALLPDQLERTVPSAGAPAPPVASTPAPEPTTTTTTTTATTEPVARTSTTPPTTDTTIPTAPPEAAELSDVALVETFYDLLPSNPDNAFDLLAPNLLSSTLGEFLDSWSTVREIDVLEVREHADGVVAVVRMVLDDGGALRIEQLLTVADSPRWITGAQLLSAQRN